MRKNTLAFLLSLLLLLLSGQNALAKANNPPKISSVTATFVNVKAQEKIKLTAIAKDFDKDKLTYLWSQTNNIAEKGIFSGSGASVYWTAPRVSEEKRIVLQVKVLDSKKAAATKPITVTVNPKSMSQLYEELKASVVTIKTEKGQGTGFVYSKDSYGATIATNYHVVRGAKDVKVTLSNGRTYSASLFLYQDFVNDWAIFSISAPNLKAVSIQKQIPKIGEEVFTISNPKGSGWILSTGIITDNATDVYDQKYLQITTPVNQGNIGGPLFNRKGEVIAFLTYIKNIEENYNLALPIAEIKESDEASVAMPFDDYFRDSTIESRIEELVDVLNEDESMENLEVGETKISNVTYAVGKVAFALDVQVSYSELINIMISHKENKDNFDEKFFTINYYLAEPVFNYSGADPFDLYYVVVDELDSPPPSGLIPSEYVRYQDGKYKIYWKFYCLTMNSDGAVEYWKKTSI